MCIESFLNTYIDFLRVRHLSENTIKSYSYDINQYVLYCQKNNIKDLSLCAKSDNIKKHLQNLVKLGLGSKSVSRKFAALKSFALYLKDTNKISILEDLSIKVKHQQSVPRMAGVKEIEKIISVISEIDNEEKRYFYLALVLLMSDAGLRISEVISLQEKHFSFVNEDRTQILNYITFTGKGNKDRFVPLSKRLCNILSQFFLSKQSFKQGNSYIFCQKNKPTDAISRQYVFTQLKSLALQCGIKYDKVSPHKLRHSFAKKMLDQGMDIRILQEILGHSNISTTEIYLKLDQKDVKTMLLTQHPLMKEFKK